MISKNTIKSLDLADNKLVILNQTKLPHEEEYIKTDDFNRIAMAIERLEVRGAPAIGIAAAYAVALGFKGKTSKDDELFTKIYERLYITRPTAVNLFWALNEMQNKYNAINDGDIFNELLKKAKFIHQDDIKKCDAIGKNGQELFTKKSAVLTHCNTGALAAGGSGTALSIITKAFKNNLIEIVYVDETRPLFQGSRLTAFELEKAEIPFKIITDSTAAFLMKNGKIDVVITGADRIARNGDAANKIGTYNLAVNCNYHNIPFYIAAPSSTIDKNCENGDTIKIEERSSKEIIELNSIKITKENYEVFSPSFDITPAGLITGIITEENFYKPPFYFG